MRIKLIEEDELYEDVLNETLYKDIVELLMIKTSGRGDTTLREFICNIIGVASEDYELHHINGHHNDNRVGNLALLKRNSRSHNSIHTAVSRKIEKDEKLKQLYSDAMVDETLLNELSNKLVYYFEDILKDVQDKIIVVDKFRKMGMRI